MTLRVAAVGTEGFGTYQLDGGRLTPADGAPDAILAPGFYDIHVHGGNGIDAMTATADEFAKLCAFFAERGYEAFLPTTVTASPEAVSAFLDRLPENPMIGGVHLEGPFISPKHPGAQPKEWIVGPPGEDSPWQRLILDPRVKLMTVAPELPGAPELIRRLTSRGVRIGMGHTDATYAEAKVGFDAGATHTTHTFNAMRGFHHREAGMAGFALAEPNLMTELIYDRLHVCRESAGILVKAKAADKLLAVSDGTAAAGLAKGTCLKMWNHDAIVGDGDVRLPDGTLAGSAITLLDAFRNLSADFGIEAAIRATSLNPRSLLGLSETPRVNVIFGLDYEIREIIGPVGV